MIAAKHLSHMSYISLRPLCLPVSPRAQTSPQCPLKVDNANGWICTHTHTHTHTISKMYLYTRSRHTNLKPPLLPLLLPPSPERLYILGLQLFPPTCLRAADRLIGGGPRCVVRWDVGGRWWAGGGGRLVEEN